MEEFNIQGKQTSFYKYCPGTFGYILVFTQILTDTGELHYSNVYFKVCLY